MNRLLLLSEDLVKQASSATVKPAVPIDVKKKLPIKPTEAWISHSNFLKKTFVFEDLHSRNSFLYQLLAYEQEKNHSAEIFIKEKSVTIATSTLDLQKVTELDREYARSADLIYREVQDLAAR